MISIPSGLRQRQRLPWRTTERVALAHKAIVVARMAAFIDEIEAAGAYKVHAGRLTRPVWNPIRRTWEPADEQGKVAKAAHKGKFRW